MAGRLGAESAQTSEQSTPSKRLFGLIISQKSADQLLSELLGLPTRGAGPRLLATVNLDHVVNLRKSERFREAYAWAWRVTIDGAPVFAYARMRGVAPPTRITGADLFASLAERWDPARHRLFFCLSSDDVATRMRTFLVKRGFDERRLEFETLPFGFERDEIFSQGLAGRIRQFAPSHLIMAIGAPKSEVWVYDNRHSLGDTTVLSVGASVQFLLGIKRRAPTWMRNRGLEWLWRLASEPRRLFRRYCIDSIGFFFAIHRDLRSNGESVV
jgi:N-acetylglucosaminyldiphosphoundecaprenol N-acetyl-beta-D-mannosaminyltransferase